MAIFNSYVKLPEGNYGFMWVNYGFNYGFLINWVLSELG